MSSGIVVGDGVVFKARCKVGFVLRGCNMKVDGVSEEKKKKKGR